MPTRSYIWYRSSLPHSISTNLSLRVSSTIQMATASSATQVLQLTVGVPCYTKEYKPVAIPQVLQDEICTINAIYGEDIITIDHAYNGKITANLSLDHSDLPPLQLAFPESYPEEPPEILDFITAFRVKPYRMRSARLIILSILQTQFIKGYECIFDMLDSCIPILQLLGPEDLKLDEAAVSIPGFIASQWLWTNTSNVKTKDPKTVKSCCICFDEHYTFQMVSLPCNHYFCIDCFHNGWAVSKNSAQPFTCCNMRISLDLIETFNVSQTVEIRRYIRMLQERDTNYPFYCGLASCNTLIGSTKECRIGSKAALARGVLCPKCSGYTCVRCRMPSHAGKCNEDKDLSVLMDNDLFRRCPNCGQGIEKNRGCSHMCCTGCGTDFTWEENGSVTSWITRSS